MLHSDNVSINHKVNKTLPADNLPGIFRNDDNNIINSSANIISPNMNTLASFVDVLCYRNQHQEFVSCGRTWVGQKIAIVNPDTLIECHDGEVGEIWVLGAHIARGYWKKPELTENTFNAYIADTVKEPFLRTGDLGFVQDGELFITGRIKDVIIIRGQNHYPQDIELTVENSHVALRAGSGAAFTVEVNNQERLVVIQEVERSYLRKVNVSEVVSNIAEAVSIQHGIYRDSYHTTKMVC